MPVQKIISVVDDDESVRESLHDMVGSLELSGTWPTDPRTKVMPMPQATATVFIVDDDMSVRESLAPLIESAGWHAEVFATAQDFLAQPRAVVPSCLILDVSLP